MKTPKDSVAKLFVIRHENLDTETDIADPNHPHLYWSNMWGWGTYDGAAVTDDSARPSQSYIAPDGTMRPAMFMESCYWEEVSPENVGWSDPIEDDDADGKGTYEVRREPCVDLGRTIQIKPPVNNITLPGSGQEEADLPIGGA